MEQKRMEQTYWKAAALLTAIGRIANFAARQNYDSAIRCYRNEFLPGYQEILAELLGHAEKWTEAGIVPDGQAVTQVLTLLTEAQEAQDYLLLADYLELYVKPFLKDILAAARQQVDILSAVQEGLSADGEADEGEPCGCKANGSGPDGWNYAAELTEEGYVTLRAERQAEAGSGQGAGGSFYLHGNRNPWLEGDAFAEEYGEDDIEGYAVLGLGLGYHALCLWNRTGGAQPVHVYEADDGLIELARRCMNFPESAGENFFIHSDRNFKKLRDAVDKGMKLVIHAPSLRRIDNEQLRKAFATFFVQESTHRNQMKLLYSNFRRNAEADMKPVEELRERFSGKRIFIVAAGPSLDKNVALLGRKRDGDVILAVGTVLRRLLGMGIVPDFCIASDANERVVNQVRSLPGESRPPLLLLSTAHYRYAQEYEGRKYRILQKDFPKAEEYAAKNGCLLFETGGSVSTTALDVAIRLGALQIVFLGLDLAYTDSRAHAAGTSNMVATDEEALHPVRAYDGGMVYSDEKFDMYRRWMEERITRRDVKAIRVIDATEGGSEIRGMEKRRLADVLCE